MPPLSLVRRVLLRACLPCLTALGVVACGQPRPNVVVVVVDTLRQDRVSAYGYERKTTPNLDRLAAEGARFDGLSPTSWTKPATASLLTGLHPLRHQAFARGDVLSESATSLAQVLARQGYSTLAVSANSWISRAWGFERGFEHFYLMKNLGGGHQAKAHQVAKVAREHLGELVPPYFVYLHFVDPHAPYDPATAWDGGPLPAEVEAFRPLTDQVLASHSWRKRPPEVMRALVDLYDGEVRHVDDELGKLITELRTRSAADDRDTIFIITSDHGEELGDHGRIGHGHTLYEETTAVPLLLHAPGRVPAGYVGGRASLMDIVPTVLELAGLEDEIAKLGKLDGTSLVPRFTAGTPSTASADSYFLHLDFDSGHGLARLEGERKFLLGKGPYLKRMFDLEADPGERRDLYAELPIAERERLAFELAKTYNLTAREALPRRTTTIDEELAASIRALGYVAHANDRGDARILPSRIKPADTLPGGLLGWEGDGPLESCLALGLGRSDAQLLDGWFPAERGEGRWTAPRAVLALGVPPAPKGHRLRLEGTSYRHDAFDLEARADDRALARLERVPPGPFAFVLDLEPALDGGRPLVLELSIGPDFIPAESLPGSTDQRILGAFLTRLCLEPR